MQNKRSNVAKINECNRKQTAKTATVCVKIKAKFSGKLKQCGKLRFHNNDVVQKLPQQCHKMKLTVAVEALANGIGLKFLHRLSCI